MSSGSEPTVPSDPRWLPTGQPYKDIQDPLNAKSEDLGPVYHPVYSPDSRKVVGYLEVVPGSGWRFDEQSPWSSFQANLPLELAREIDAVCRESHLAPDEFLAGALSFYLKAYRAIRDGGSVQFVMPGDERHTVTVDRLTNPDKT